MRDFATAASATEERSESGPLPAWQCLIAILAMSALGYWAIFRGAVVLSAAFNHVRAALFP
jgi:hypothetical protein